MAGTALRRDENDSMKIFGSAMNQDKKTVLSVCLFLAVFVLWIDYITGRFIQFPITFIFPVGIAAWYKRIIMATALAFLLPLARIAFHCVWNEKDSISIAVINSLIYIITLLIYEYLTFRVADQKRELEKEVNVLQGLLPICSSYKKIRNTDGSWKQIEGYMKKHSEAQFTHSILP
jgi:hypothetical protein